jgi:nucleoside-diphosphate-sugar epimerase
VKQDFLDPAIEGNLGLLRAAAKTPSVKRIVITSSVAAILNASTGVWVLRRENEEEGWGGRGGLEQERIGKIGDRGQKLTHPTDPNHTYTRKLVPITY